MPTSSKSIFTSKMFWTNVVALIGMIVQGLTGNELLVGVEVQAAVLSIVNILLRTVTKEPVTWQ